MLQWLCGCRSYSEGLFANGTNSRSQGTENKGITQTNYLYLREKNNCKIIALFAYSNYDDNRIVLRIRFAKTMRRMRIEVMLHSVPQVLKYAGYFLEWA